MKKKHLILSFCIVFFLANTVVAFLESCEPAHNREASPFTFVDSAATYVGSAGCQSCHAEAFEDWKKSDHFQAMLPAHDSTVLGDFSGVSFRANGVENRFFKKDGKFFMNTQGDDGKNHDYEVLYIFGHYPLQQYLIAFPGGRLQASRASWDSREKKWFHQYAGQEIYHGDWIHWTGNGQNWNTMCASCHSTNLRKNYDFNADAYHTSWSEINVSCESCHGPGSTHIQFMNSEAYQKGDSLKNSGLYYSKNPDPKIQLNSCAPCHARKSDLSDMLVRSNEVLDDMIPQLISTDFYHADGQVDEEDYVFGSFTQSKMYHNDVRCTNCHNPHSGKLLLAGNDLCMSCHEPKYNSPDHHFHPQNTESSQCINCHMPAKYYMGNDLRRDHSFRVPRPDQSVTYKTPNSCTACHPDKTNTWAANAITDWYGPDRAYHFSDDLLPGSQLTEKSEVHLLKLLADSLQPEIARATAAFYLGNIPTRQSADMLIRMLKDKKAWVRYQALRSLENFPSDIWLNEAYPCLTDKVRAVRIAAASLYHLVQLENIPASAQTAYAAARAENEYFLQYQTDFAVGNVMMADYQLQEGDYLNAIKYYLRGLEKDSLMNYARLNLSAALNNAGNNNEALQTLNEAAAIDPENDRIYFNLGLLYYELGDIPAALENFQKAMRLGSPNPSLYYNYGLLLQQTGKLKEGEQVLLSGFALNPQATNINYALAYLYLSQNLPQKARIYAEMLQRIDPNNPEYQRMFRDLGL
jgi:predicted CXXCH cytochrome family protein